MISIAGLTLTTLPPFSRLYRKADTPQLEQRIEKVVFSESRLSASIRSELEKAAQLLPGETPTLKAEAVDAEWEESPLAIDAETEAGAEAEAEIAADPEPDPDPTIEPPPQFAHYPIALVDLHSTTQQLPQYPHATVALTAELAAESTTKPTTALPRYTQFNSGLHYTSGAAERPPLTHYPQSEFNLIAYDEEEAFEVDAEHIIKESEEGEESEATDEAQSWLPTRERADALFAVCQLYSQMEDTEIPLTILIGGSDEDELLQLSSESLDGAIHLKQQMDETIEVFGFDTAQSLFDHLFYCSITPDRNGRLRSLLSTITPIIMESMLINDEAERELLYQQIFDHLFEAGEFLSSEREPLFSKWHEEFIPPAPPQPAATEQEGELSPEEAFTPPSESAQERIAAALENLQQQQELELTTPQQQERASIELERERLSRKRKISRIDTLSRQQGLPLEQLLDHEQQSKEESEQLLDLLLSARSDPAEEYTHFHGHLKGTPADLLIESLLRIQLQNRTCSLYQQFRHLQEFELIEQRIFDHLQEEFGEVVVKSHRSSIEQDIEWASSSSRPHCNNSLLPQQAEL